MPSNNSTNTPPNRRNLRSSIQTDISLENIKIMVEAAIEKSKNEIINSLKEELKCLKITVSSLVSRVEKLEEDNKVLFNQHQETLNSSAASISFDSKCAELLEEMKQRDLRKCNVVIYGVREPTTGNVHERRQADEDKCDELFEFLGISHGNVQSVKRLGKKREDNKRILCVTLKDENSKHLLIKRSKQLRRSPSYENIFIKPDLTFVQRQLDYELRKELQKRKTAEPDKDFVIHKGRITERSNLQNFRNEF